jgi:hypothetical protein
VGCFSVEATFASPERRTFDSRESTSFSSFSSPESSASSFLRVALIGLSAPYVKI